MKYDVIIIGGGASGLMLAASLNLHDLRNGTGKGLLLEKTSSPGTKLLLSGGGRCNITHGGSVKEFPGCYGESGLRLRKCLYHHSNAELASWLEDHGIELADEKGNRISSYMLFDQQNDIGRVFPASMKASDVLNVFLSSARSNGWEIRTESEVYDIMASEDGSSGWTVKVSPADLFEADAVVIATGGITFPETGSDGSFFSILTDLDVHITPLRSALAPVYVEEYPYEELSGISLSGVTVTAFSSDSVSTCKGKSARMTGDLLFTHRGFSGPVMLNISRHAEPGELIRISYGRELADLPKRMQHALESRSKGPSGDIRTTVLAALLDKDDFKVASVDPNGMVTAGGISLDSIDATSMQLSDLAGLYAIGEVLDVDGITGGYNLQMCWSTACTAADSIRDQLNK